MMTGRMSARGPSIAVAAADALVRAGDLVVIGEAENLLRARQGVLVLAEFRGVARDAVLFQFHHLIDDAEAGRVGGSGQIGADAEYVDGRAARPSIRESYIRSDRRWP